MNTQHDPMFYVNSPTSEIVWSKPDFDFYVIRNGEMRIHHKGKVARYTQDLASIGIESDSDLEDEAYEFIENPWFEVCDKRDPTWSSEPIFDIDEAFETCVSYQNGEIE